MISGWKSTLNLSKNSWTSSTLKMLAALTSRAFVGTMSSSVLAVLILKPGFRLVECGDAKDASAIYQ
jgi:hypothetical protein